MEKFEHKHSLKKDKKKKIETVISSPGMFLPVVLLPTLDICSHFICYYDKVMIHQSNSAPT